MAEAGFCRLGKTIRSLCSLRAKSRLLYAHDKVCGCFSSQRRHLTGRPDDGVAEYDVVIVGTGIVGLGTAVEMISRYPNLTYAVLDKESSVAAHQTGNNSGVIHAGIYYMPGTLKAKLCVEGSALMYQYCDANNVPYKKCGKLIVAVEPMELPRLDDLYDRSQKNSVPDVRMLSPEEVKAIEPNCTALRALYSPHTGIIDYTLVTQSLARTYRDRGGKIHMGFKVTGFSESVNRADYPVTIEGTNTNVFFDHLRIRAKYVISCAGLHSDRVAAFSGCSSNPKIVPFRGEYLKLKDTARDLVHTNIYPVPDPSLPFLGVHFTPRMNGDVWLGPNAILAFKREGYRFRDFNPLDFADSIAFGGLWKLIFSNFAYAADQLYCSFFLSAQVKQLQRFIPKLKVADVEFGKAGVRAQALSPDGKLVDDFVFDKGTGSIGSRMLHVRNAPSPAATSSLAIAKMVADRAKELFNL